MSVWLCMPSKRPPEEVEPILNLWREQGYKIAVQRDPGDVATLYANVVFSRPYSGYSEAVNYIASQVLMMESDADWIVCAGDDTEPDANHTAEEIDKQCSVHFKERAWPKCWHWAAGYATPEAALAAGAYAEQKPQALWSGDLAKIYSTFGVMQPTGDKWGSNNRKDAHTFTARAIEPLHLCSSCGHPKNNARHMVGSYIDRVAGSPWMGREWCLRANQGKGPLWQGYFHMGCDEELQAVATRLGVFWQRPDLIHLHKHWGRGTDGQPADSFSMPDFLKRANSQEEWDQYKKLFAERQAAGFPGSEPL